MKSRRILLTLTTLLWVFVAQAARITFFSTNRPADVEEISAFSGTTELQSGAVVSTGTKVTFKAQNAYGFVVDWYVDDKLVAEAVSSYTKSVTKSITVEARYHEAYKVIFAGTPFTKYATNGNIVYLTQNFYHHTSDHQHAFYYSVDGWNDESGKLYAVDNEPNDTTFSTIKLTRDLVLTPHYVLNEEDLGDGTANPSWEFGMPDSIVCFDNFRGKCSFVKPEMLQSSFVDINMTCDATQGGIHNKDRRLVGNAIVKSGTRFTLPSRYGCSYKLVTTRPLSATTIAGRTDYTTTREQAYYAATLPYYDSQNDSIDIVVGEDIELVRIVASYPGGNTSLSWTPNLNTAENQIGTKLKTGGAGSLLYGLSDITNNGYLRITASAADSLTSQIEMTSYRDEHACMSVSFQVADGFAFKLTSATLPMRLDGAGKSGQIYILLSDERGNRLDTLITSATSDSLRCDTLMNKATSNGTEVFFYGKVTLRWYVYGTPAKYRLSAPITIDGEICETITCGPGNTWGTYVTKTPIDKDGLALLAIDVYEVTGVYEKRIYINKTTLEEIPQGDPVLLHTEEPGAVFNIPLTRCDDAYESGNNLLRVSDGKVVSDRTVYRFQRQNGNYLFHLVNDQSLVPEGEVYLEYDGMTDPEFLYINSKDVPTGIDAVPCRALGTVTVKLLRNGRLHILRPDGKLYTVDGVQQK